MMRASIFKSVGASYLESIVKSGTNWPIALSEDVGPSEKAQIRL